MRLTRIPSSHNLITALFIACFFLCAPLFASAEKITNFSSDILLNADGSFLVEELITYDFEGIERHGIFRDLEKRHPQESSSVWKDRSIEIELQSVLQDGNAAQYELTDSRDNLNIKIGDPDATITGEHRYLITYIVRGGLSYFDNETGEIYWNITGNGWEVPIDHVIAIIRGKEEYFADTAWCYQGAFGATAECDSKEVQEDTVVFEAHNLRPYEGLTVAQMLNVSSIGVIVIEQFNWTLILMIVIPLMIIALAFFAYRYKTHFKTGAPIIAQYEPYAGVKPMYAGMLLDGNLDPRDITAGIVYLAEQGFIKIRKIDRKVLFLFEVDDYQLELLRPLSEIESDFLYDVITLIFSDPGPVGEVVTLSLLKADESKQRLNAARLMKLRKDLKKDMAAQGFYQVNEAFAKALAVTGISFFVVLIISDMLPGWLFGALLFSTVTAFLVCLIRYERRTRKGYEAQDHLKGFKLFLKVTDEERFKFHNAPQKSPEQFLQYLPYAIAFGVEREWATAFADITIPNPSWYDGGTAGFSAVNLTSSLGAFSSSFVASTGASGSSGGGSSGGGGGGGGGGSW
jgi:uncharacterized membrane protein